MKRILFAALVGSALLMASPASALAYSHHHRRHHARFQREHWGPSDRAQGTTDSGNAGTVASFANGVLTIKLADGSSVTGRVTDATELECTSPSTESQSGNDGSGDGQPSSGSGSDSQSSGSDSQSSSSDSQSTGGDSQSTGDEDQSTGDEDQSSTSSDQGDSEDGHDSGQSCGTSALTTGAVVREAELVISPTAGAVWHKLDLQDTSGSSSPRS